MRAYITNMPGTFNFSASPFDRLTAREQQLVRDSVDIAYFREGETILDRGAETTHLFVIIKGYVSQHDGNEIVATFGPDDSFDGRSLVAGRSSSRFVATEEVLAYQLARKAVNELISSNATFGALLFADLSHKLSALAQRPGQREMQSLALARVDQAFLRPAHVVDAGTDIVAVTRVLHGQRTSSVLVRDTASTPARLGIFTSTGLQRAILDGRPLAQLPVHDVATFPLVSINPQSSLFDALALMIKHQVHRLVVADGEKIVGLLEQLDALSFLSNHSYLITVQIVQANDLETLRGAAQQITHLITLLYRGGTRVSAIAKLVQELNAKLFERTWQLIAPPELVAASCLFVMGSEGRGEQLLKTDQDNGLVLRDDHTVPPDVVVESCQRFSDALRTFGYPDCPGGIMVRNPDWRHSATEFGQTVRRWLLQPDPASLMALAIFLDAHAVSGDAQLLARVRGEVDGLVGANDVLLGRFAAAIDSFPEAGTAAWWNRLLLIGENDKEVIDLKKGGIFPIVHGVRSFALQEHIGATSTAARLDALVASGRLSAELATDLLDSLHFLIALKLGAGIAELDAGRPVSGGVQLDKLSSLERDLLKDAFAVVKRFKAIVRHHFHLET
jgi:CBS domain-containing protein